LNLYVGKHTHPGFGTDPQAVINEQIGDTYDVFIGIIWSRFGTPTPRADSGTLEEFERALARRNREGDIPDIMIYFKETPLSPAKIEPEQLNLVAKFRESIAGRGGLYSVFDDTSAFQTSLRAHLATLAQKFSSPPSQKADLSGSSMIQTREDLEDLGFLDYLEISGSRIAEFISTLDVISEAARKFDSQISKRVSDTNRLVEVGFDMKSAKNVMSVAAKDMESYSDILKSNLPFMTSSRTAAMNALANALLVYEEFSKSNSSTLLELRGTLKNLHKVSAGSAETLSGFRTSVHGIPRMTGELNRAKRSVTTQLDLIMSEIQSLAHNIENIVVSIDKMLARH
jgi:hypothetical protein